jgi:hypothetical protein
VAQAPVRIAPRFRTGQTLRYRVETRTVTEARSAGIVEDPQGASKSEIQISTVVRLEILRVEPAGAAGLPSRVRIRTTYEKCTVRTASDSFDPTLAVLEEQYRKLEGRSIEFTLDDRGHVTEVTGLKELIADEASAAAARDWLAQMAAPAAVPAEGIAQGQSWSSEREVSGLPLLGFFWRADSTYVRDAACASESFGEKQSEPPTRPESSARCAVLATRLTLVQIPAKEQTPEEFRRQGLRTAGTMTGSGESLAAISLEDGILFRSSMTTTQEMDVTISTGGGAVPLRLAGRVHTECYVTLLPHTGP